MSTLAGWPYGDLLKKVYLPHFQQKGEKAIPYFVTAIIARRSFLSAYKKLDPIENMPKKEKSELKKYVNDLFPDMSTEEKMDACKIIYTLGSIVG